MSESLLVHKMWSVTSREYSSDAEVFWSESSVVDIEARLRAGQSWVQITVQARDLSVFQKIPTGSGVHPGSYGYRDCFPRPGPVLNHSPPSNAKVENEWSYISTPHLCFMGVQENFTLMSFVQDIRICISASKIHTAPR